jgi:hypothetical protein
MNFCSYLLFLVILCCFLFFLFFSFFFVTGKALVELQVTGVQANAQKKPDSSSISLTVHSLLVVDALQSYGQDFELLVASHHNVQ